MLTTRYVTVLLDAISYERGMAQITAQLITSAVQ